MAEAETVDTVWRLDKYARYTVLRKGGAAGHWKQYSDAADSPLMLTLTDTNHLVILQGSVVLESHSLVTARAWMRGLAKTDSLLFMYKQGKGTRRFKVKFDESAGETGSQRCRRVATALSRLFCVHFSTPAPAPAPPAQVSDTGCSLQPGADNSHGPEQLEGEVTLAEMAHVVLGESQARLPGPYRTDAAANDTTTSSLDVSDDVMANHLRLFLADPSFPSFVERVDRQLRHVIAECQE